MARRTFWAIALLAAWPAIAHADSDGYYCTGRGYLAYETRFSTPGLEHVLHVVRFSQANGITREQRIPLEDFQVHGMRCGEHAIELAAWTKRYLIDLSAPEPPRVRTEDANFASRGTSQSNLGHWALEGVVDLESDGQPGEFQLVIGRVSRRVPGGIERYTLTQLIRRDPKPGGQILAVQRIFEGIFLESVDTAFEAETG
jgi:hypothetical protein